MPVEWAGNLTDINDLFSLNGILVAYWLKEFPDIGKGIIYSWVQPWIIPILSIAGFYWQFGLESGKFWTPGSGGKKDPEFTFDEGNLARWFQWTESSVRQIWFSFMTSNLGPYIMEPIYIGVAAKLQELLITRHCSYFGKNSGAKSISELLMITDSYLQCA